MSKSINPRKVRESSPPEQEVTVSELRFLEALNDPKKSEQRKEVIDLLIAEGLLTVENGMLVAVNCDG